MLMVEEKQDIPTTQEPANEETGQADNEDYKSKYLYLLAEVENYKKAKDKEIKEYINFSNIHLMTDILKVLDDFDSVMKAEKDEKVEALYKSLMSVLSTYGLERLNVVGLDYSHDIAESVGVEKSDKPGGKIIQEIQAGYKLNGKTIRYPKVKVAL